MRDCAFLLADGTIEAVFTEFFQREGCHHSLNTCQINFDPNLDIIRGQSDPDTYERGHDLLRGCLRSHRFALIVLDNDWDGSPGPEAIRNRIRARMLADGWSEDQFEVIVIDPELENWIWVDGSPHIVTAFNYNNAQPLREFLQHNGFWQDGFSKPTRPKEAVEFVLRRTRIPRSSAIYRQIVRNISVKGCTDPAFQLMLTFLQGRFPR